jgi:Flp pilus assembly protein TadG
MLIGMSKIMRNMLRKFVGETKGIAAIEIAFILPFMLLIYLGLFDITALVSVNRKVTYSASIVADLVAQNKTSVLKSKLSDYYSAANLVMAPISSSAVRVEVFGYRISGSTVSLIWKTNNGQATSCGTNPSTTAMAPLMVAGNDLVVARVCTTYEIYAANFLGHTLANSSSFVISESITQRPRSTLKLTCYNTTVGGTVCS